MLLPKRYLRQRTMLQSKCDTVGAVREQPTRCLLQVAVPEQVCSEATWSQQEARHKISHVSDDS